MNGDKSRRESNPGRTQTKTRPAGASWTRVSAFMDGGSREPARWEMRLARVRSGQLYTCVWRSRNAGADSERAQAPAGPGRTLFCRTERPAREFGACAGNVGDPNCAARSATQPSSRSFGSRSRKRCVGHRRSPQALNSIGVETSRTRRVREIMKQAPMAGLSDGDCRDMAEQFSGLLGAAG